MEAISAEKKDKVLKWFYEADVKGNELPRSFLPMESEEICAILTTDGYIQNGKYRSELTLKGQAFVLNGGYVKEREEKERPLKIAEEANKKACRANLISILAIIVSVLIGGIGFLQKAPHDSPSQYMNNVNAITDSSDGCQDFLSSDTLILNPDSIKEE